MNKTISFLMIVGGIGLFVFGLSDYVPAGSGDPGGWSDSCRYVMTAGAMLAASGKLLS
jgi:hypothetical protein